MIGLQSAIRLIVSVIFNQSVPRETALAAPGKLLARLGRSAFDLSEMRDGGFDALYGAIAEKPCLHRFPKMMAKNLYETVVRIANNYEGDPRRIWRDRNEEEILRELQKLPGIGPHKAIQCLLLLAQVGEIGRVSEERIAYLAASCPGCLANVEGDARAIVVD